MPHPHRARLRVEVVFRNHVAVPDVGVSGRAILIEEQLFGACLQIDDAVVLAVASVDVLFDDQPAAALVDLALVEVAHLRIVGEVGRVLAVDQAPQHLPGPVLAQRRGVDPVVVAGVELEDVLVAAELRRRVEDRLHLPAEDVVAE